MKTLCLQRKDVGLTQIELSLAAKLPKYKIQLAENGIPVLTTPEAIRISKILGFGNVPDFIKTLIEEDSENECI